MTIVEIKNQLISHFNEKETFDLESDSVKIALPDDLEQVRKEVITTALIDLGAGGMIKPISNAQKTIWILQQSFDTLNQTLVISATTSELIGEVINQFRDANNISGDTCDKSHITESDIINIINIINVLLENEDPDLEKFDTNNDTEEGDENE